MTSSGHGHAHRLTDAIIHVNPPEGAQAHARTAHGPTSPRAATPSTRHSAPLACVIACKSCNLDSA
jgi:hypothetical protein